MYDRIKLELKFRESKKIMKILLLLVPVVVIVVYTVLYRIHKKISRPCSGCGSPWHYTQMHSTQLLTENGFGIVLVCEVDGCCSNPCCHLKNQNIAETSHEKFVPHSYFSLYPFRRWRFRKYFNPKGDRFFV